MKPNVTWTEIQIRLSIFVETWVSPWHFPGDILHLCVNSSTDSEAEAKEKADKYEEKGVDEEAGLRKLIDSEEEDEEEEEKNEDNDEDKGKEGKSKKTGVVPVCIYVVPIIFIL